MTTMKKYSQSLLGSFCLLALIPIAAQAQDHEGHDHKDGQAEKMMATPLIAKLQATEGNETSGTIMFKMAEDGKGVTITMKVKGLQPNSKHAIHVHEFGDLSAADGTSAGGHFNPEGHDHGLPEQEMRHVGDLGNLDADEDGNAEKTMTVSNMSLTHGKNAVLGRGVVVHVAEDKGTQPTGDAGARIAVGVIGIQKSEK